MLYFTNNPKQKVFYICWARDANDALLDILCGEK